MSARLAQKFLLKSARWRFNRQAKENAELNLVKLLDQSDLAVMLEKYEVTMLEVERILFAEWQQSDVAV